MIDLPSWQPPSTCGTPIPKPSRFDRKVSKAKRVQEENASVQAAVKPKRKAIGSRLRAMVMERDKHCCVLCGDVGSESNPLQIGHVTPVAAGGNNDESNLRTECRECNLGGGARKRPAPDRTSREYDNIVEQVSKLVGKKKSILDKGSAEKGAVSKQWAHGTISSLSQSPSPEQQYS